MSKDTQDRASASDVDLKSYLADAYLHPIFHSFEEVDLVEVKVDKTEDHHIVSPSPSELSSPSPQHANHQEEEPSQSVQHYEVEPPHTAYHYEMEQHYTAYNYDVESHSNTYSYDGEPHYQYYHY